MSNTVARSVAAAVLFGGWCLAVASAAPPTDPIETLLSDAYREAFTSWGTLPGYSAWVEMRLLEPLLPAPRDIELLTWQLAADGRGGPLLRWQLTAYLLQRGRGVAPEPNQAALSSITGVVPAWLIGGPFPNDNGTGYATPMPPETFLLDGLPPATDCSQCMWRSADVTPATGIVDVSLYAYPKSDGVSYALAAVTVDRPRSLALRWESAGPIKLWWNSYELTSGTSGSTVESFCSEAGISVPRGLHYLLVKVCQGQQDWRFRVRITAPDGSPIDGLTFWDGTAPFPDALPDTSDIAAEEVVSLVDELQASKVPVGDEDSEIQWALLALDAGSFISTKPRALPQLAKLARSFPDSPRAVFIAATAESNKHARRLALQRVLELDPDNAPAAFLLAESYRQEGYVYLALDYVNQLLANHPGTLSARVLRASLMGEAYWPGESLAVLEALRREYPDRLAVEEALATQYLYAILPRQSAEHLNSALKLAPWREDLAISLLNAQRMRMDFAESLAAVEHGLTYNPDSRTLRLAYAELLARNGRAAEADAILTAHLRRAPLDVSARESAGRWLIDAGQRERGIEELHHAAQLQPQQKSLQGYLEFLSAALPDLPSRFRVALDLEKEHPDLLADETARGSAILLDSRTIERLPSGGQRTYHQQVIRISGPSGAKSWSRIPLLYAPSRQRLDVLSARLLKPDGRSFPAREFTTGLLSDPAIRTYYDDSYWVADFSAANPAAGDIIELEYVLSDQLRDATALRFLGTVVQPQREIPVARFILRILLPSDSSLTCAAFRTAGLALAEQPARQQLGHQEALIWDARSLPAIPLEPQAPPYASLLPAIVISPFVSWEELGQWYRGFIEEQLQPDDRITDKAAELAPPEMDRRHRIAAIYSWVTTQTRYVGLELGVHGYKPYAASDVFLRRFGDCKDKSALLCALLNSADIAAWPVILRTQNAGDLPADVPALTLFNHMICYLPDDDIWLDPTVMDGTLAEFPISDQNCLCLKLPPAGPYLQPERSPSSPPALNTAHLMIDVRLKKGGAAEAALTLDANGELARALRSGVREATADVMAEEMAAREIREAAISTVFWDPGAVTGSRVKLRADAALHVTTDTAGAVSFPCLGSPLHLLSAYGAFPFRRLPLNAETPRTIKRTVRIRIPRRARVSHLPEGVHLEGSYGSFSAEFKVEKREVTGTATLIWHGGTIRPTDYLGFRAFCSQIDMLFQQSIRLHLPQRFRQPPVNEPAEHAPR